MNITDRRHIAQLRVDRSLLKSKTLELRQRMAEIELERANLSQAVAHNDLLQVALDQRIGLIVHRDLANRAANVPKEDASHEEA